MSSGLTRILSTKHDGIKENVTTKTERKMTNSGRVYFSGTVVNFTFSRSHISYHPTNNAVYNLVLYKMKMIKDKKNVNKK